MNEFVYTIVISAENKEEAEQVLRERLDHDEDYGFNYTLNIISKRAVDYYKDKIREEIEDECGR